MQPAKNIKMNQESPIPRPRNNSSERKKRLGHALNKKEKSGLISPVKPLTDNQMAKKYVTKPDYNTEANLDCQMQETNLFMYTPKKVDRFDQSISPEPRFTATNVLKQQS